MRYRSLKGKTIVLTGAAGGIGSILANKLFCQEGSSLLLVDKNGEKLKELKASIEGVNKPSELSIDTAKLLTFEADLSSRTSLENLCDELGKQEVDILINNAAIVYAGSFGEMDSEDFDSVIRLNLGAVVRLTHFLMPKIIQRRGFIVNVASGAGLAAFPGLSAYTTSKFGLVGFSEALRAELRGVVGVSTVCPAFVATEIMKNSILSSQLNGQEQGRYQGELDALVQRFGTDPERVANIIIKSIKKNRGLVQVGLITHFLCGMKRFSPGLFDRVNAFVYRRLVARGVLR